MFDIQTACFIWKKSDARNTVFLPLLHEVPTRNKHLVKPIEDIQGARGKKANLTIITREMMYENEHDIDFEKYRWLPIKHIRPPH